MREDAVSTGPTSHEGMVVAGKFRLERVLGEGGMGVVYAAVHLDLLKHVAVKIIRDELASRADVVGRMLNEARTAARLRSEHVASVLDVGQTETGAPFIVMEYLDGCDFASHLASVGRLAPETAVLYLLQACEAVAEAHAEGIVHCDIKPENLFLSSRTDGEPIVKVLDFGIARNLSARARALPDDASGAIGSPNYMAPEAIRVDPNVGPAADIWSLGAVLYELVTGRAPFDADTVEEIFERAMKHTPARLSTHVPAIPQGLEAVVLRCLEKKESDRFETVAELATARAPFGAPGSAELAARVTRIGTAGVVASTPLRSVQGNSSRPRPRRPATVSAVRWRTKRPLLVALAVGATVLTAFTWESALGWIRAGSASDAVPSRVANAAPATAAVAATAVATTTAAPPAIAQQAPSSQAAPRPSEERPTAKRPTRRRSAAPAKAEPQPTPAATATEAEAQPIPEPRREPDPWDRSAFGGRR